jgi:hypothetical protein
MRRLFREEAFAEGAEGDEADAEFFESGHD